MSTNPQSPIPSTSRDNNFIPEQEIINAYREVTCPPCGVTFRNRFLLQEHIYSLHPEFYSIQIGEGVSGVEQIFVHPVLQTLNISTKYAAEMEEYPCYDSIDETTFLGAVRLSSFEAIKRDLVKWKNLRVFFTAEFNFAREQNGIFETKPGPFCSFSHLVFSNTMISRVWNLLTQHASSYVEDFIVESSGWRLISVTSFGFVTIKYQFTKIGKYIPTPYPLTRHSKCLLNIDSRSSDVTLKNKCFLWSVLAHPKLAGVPAGRHNHRSRIDKKLTTYAKHMQKVKKPLVNICGLKFPMTLNQLAKFEKLNPHISLTVLGYDMDGKKPPKFKKNPSYQDVLNNFNYIQSKISILHNSTFKKNIHIDLMCLMRGNFAHFILIRNLEWLMKSPNSESAKNICRNCLQNFITRDTLDFHEGYCAGLGLQRVTYPKGHQAFLKFNRWERTQPVPFRFYADFEAFLPEYCPSSPDELNLSEFKTNFKGQKQSFAFNSSCRRRSHLHKPCGYSWICVDFEGNRRHGEYYHAVDDGEDIAGRFIQSIVEYSTLLEKEILEYEASAPEMLEAVFTPEPLNEANKRRECCFCQVQFDDQDIIVRHHMHLPPFPFVGLAHQQCNLQASIRKEFPVFLHNFSSYDVHFLVQSLGQLEVDKVISDVKVIAKTSEKYMSISISRAPEHSPFPEDSLSKFKIRFVDSLGFTLKSLEKLVKVMKTDPNATFPITRQEFHREIQKGGDINLLFEKGAYPYSSMQSCSDFQQTSLPAKENFYNELREEPIDAKVYEHAQKVWESFGIENMGQWHDLYVRLDVSLLADVMEGVRKLMMDSYQLDLAHYYTLPMMSLDCALKKSRVTLELLSNATMHCFIEHAIRGGYVSIGSQRVAAANNPYMKKEYDPQKPLSYILYVDANNLYGKAMSYPLPIGDFKWLTRYQVTRVQKDIARFLYECELDQSIGYFLEVDLEIDPSLHNQHNDYPPAPLRRCVREDELSNSYQKPLIDALGISGGMYKVEKLIADLNNKKKYILHPTILKQYVNMGVKVTKVHRGISYTQSPWMKPFIDYNTEMRSKATTNFEKDFWKLLNNSAFGKTIEQVRKRQNVVIVNSIEKALYFNKKPTVKNVTPINPNTCVFMMKKLAVRLNKPIFTGVAVLDISKSIMYEHHTSMQQRYGDKCRLIYTDTDSLIYHVQTEDIYKDMKENQDQYDMSEYPKAHPDFGQFHSLKNEKVLGKFKDEYSSSVITNIVCPRPKMYTIRALRVKEVKDEGGRVLEYISDSDGAWVMEEFCSKKVKGITHTAVEKQLTFDDFARVIATKTESYVQIKGFRSVEHRIFTESSMKRALNGLDTKRFAKDHIFTLAFGHKDISKHQNSTICPPNDL